MYKFLYRMILVTTLSCALISQSFALTQNADGTMQGTDTKTVQGVKDQGSMLTSLTMIAVGVVAASVALAFDPSTITTDMWSAAIAGAAFIAAEIVSTKEVQSATLEITQRSDGKADNAQIAALQNMKAVLEKVKKSTETKKMIQNIAAMAFLAATAIALLMWWDVMVPVKNPKSTGAGYLKALAFAPGLMAALAPILEPMVMAVGTAMSTPPSRAAVWGGFAALSFNAVSESEKMIKELADRIAKVDGIMASMQSQAAVAAASTATTVNATIPNNYNTSQNLLSSSLDTIAIPCVTSPSGTSCPPLSKALPNTPGWNSAGASLQLPVTGLTGFMDKTSGARGATREALLAAGSMAGDIVPVQSAIKNAKAAINAKLVAMGQPAVDFNKAQADMMKQLNQVTASALQKAGTTAAAVLGALGAGSSASAAIVPAKTPSVNKATVTPVAVIGLGASSRKGGNFSLKDDSRPALETGPDVAANLAGLDIKKGDVSKDSGASIFNIISERYLKTGFSRLLEEAPPVQVPMKK
jgi:hypothetical protein